MVTLSFFYTLLCVCSIAAPIWYRRRTHLYFHNAFRDDPRDYKSATNETNSSRDDPLHRASCMNNSARASLEQATRFAELDDGSYVRAPPITDCERRDRCAAVCSPSTTRGAPDATETKARRRRGRGVHDGEVAKETPNSWAPMHLTSPTAAHEHAMLRAPFLSETSLSSSLCEATDSYKPHSTPTHAFVARATFSEHLPLKDACAPRGPIAQHIPIRYDTRGDIVRCNA
jgi:hypothetical protein